MSRGVVIGTVPNSHQKILTFYGRSPIFSNFYHCPFDLEGYRWQNTEQYFQYAKARYFGDKKAQWAIKCSNTPDEQKRLGRNVKNYSESQWKEVREAMLKGAIAKFRQNSKERFELFQTIGMKLAEATQYDMVWSTGIRLGDRRGFNEDQWPGLNLLGNVLMKARDYLQREFKDEIIE